MLVWSSLGAATLMLGAHVDASRDLGVRSPQVMTVVTLAPTTSAAVPVTTASPAGSYFQTIWDPIANVTLGQNAEFDYKVPISVEGSILLVLCQTNATGAEPLDASNTWSVTQITDPCEQNSGAQCSFNTSAVEHVSITFEAGSLAGTPNLSNFFLCFGTSPNNLLNDFICDSYSPFFDIAEAAGEDVRRVPRPLATPTTALQLALEKAVVSISGISSASATTPNYAVHSSVYVTVIASATPASSSIAPAVPVSKKGLSTGALAGIVVGAALGFLVVAFIACFCVRRRKRTRSNRMDGTSSPHEHVLLTQTYSSILSRDLLAEKGAQSPITASVLETPLSRPVLPQNPRHSFDSLNASAPYSGLAAAIPRARQPPPISQSQLQPQNQNPQPYQQSLLSHSIATSSLSAPLTRGISTASRGISEAPGPISPRSTVRGEGDEFAEYHNAPIYGDARHRPTVYKSYPSLQAPFLTDENMSAEEIERLEEEERRIDAAIAEAERGGMI